MDFALNEIQEVLKSTAQKFFKEKCTVTALRTAEASENKFSPSFYNEIAEMGFLGLCIPEEFDGAGGSLLDLALVVEEAGAALFSSPFSSTLSYGVLPILQYGTTAQKNELLPEIAEGKLLVTGAFSEPQAHYDLSYISSVAKEKGGTYSLTGKKMFVPFATTADYFLTLARTTESPAGSEGLSLFLVKGKQAGVHIKPLPSIGSDGLYEVEFDGVTVTSEDLLGSVDQGWETAQKIIEAATALQCIEIIGLLNKAVTVTTDYVKERHQFKRPIGSFQAVQHRLADMFTIVEGGRLAAYHAISRLNDGVSAETETAIAKAFICKEGQKVMVGAHQLHGGMGIDMDYPLQFCFRRFKSMQLNLGPANFQLKKVAKSLSVLPVTDGQLVN
ncbi:acyl-CoA/acyl-ACP dehydrogenase [Bacillus sp. AGMB 02131]|uniref:Acyl-CoA/acyl-ACP dehydrogenase n=1 Tax=Peribacillus faecalis TaxID=2772559 RepID=A0A927CT21_9BACI|nr:acyl-CoA dehydrogenase family protein [Peribacillus faecalis]MBD3107342.1 acyl-CoA/acyl-ACP dehydrogenase [Peribacillus faecalis]